MVLEKKIFEYSKFLTYRQTLSVYTLEHPRSIDALTERGVPSVAILFGKKIFIRKLYENLKSLLMPIYESGLTQHDNNGKSHSSKMS